MAALYNPCCEACTVEPTWVPTAVNLTLMLSSSVMHAQEGSRKHFQTGPN